MKNVILFLNLVKTLFIGAVLLMVLTTQIADAQTASPGGGGTGSVPTGGSASSSFLSLNGNFIYPPCLRGDAAQNAQLSCVQDSIIYYTNALLVLIAAGAFLYVLYGAFQYTTAYGDEAKVKQARSAIQYAVIGMVIALLARLAVALIKSVLKA